MKLSMPKIENAITQMVNASKLLESKVSKAFKISSKLYSAAVQASSTASKAHTHTQILLEQSKLLTTALTSAERAISPLSDIRNK